jgi:dihydroorotate dehydrogenase electron transfer subunit
MVQSLTIKLLRKTQLTADIFQFTCLAPKIAATAQPGQFISVAVSETLEPFLRRPFSLYHWDTQSGEITFIFQIRGRGTEFLANTRPGAKLKVLGPLGGQGFNVGRGEHWAILGGGIGIFPLYQLARTVHARGGKVDFYLGFRSRAQVILESDFKAVSERLVITTDDGSYGETGSVLTQFTKDFSQRKKVTRLGACGPLPMLQALSKFVEKHQLPSQFSLEQRMGCGIGACMGCPVRLVTADQTISYGRVCKDGPVFSSDKIMI